MFAFKLILKILPVSILWGHCERNSVFCEQAAIRLVLQIEMHRIFTHLCLYVQFFLFKQVLD